MSSEDDTTRRARWETRVDAEIRDIREDVHDTKRDIREIHDTLAGRPSWAVTTLLTTLTAACSMLATMLAIAVR